MYVVLKNRVYIVFLSFLIIVLLSCRTNNESETLLVQIDSFLLVYPDSALSLLRAMNISNENISIKAKYALLLTKTEDKNYILHTSDSLINIAVCYYDSIDDVEQSAISHYYLGRVLQDMQNEAAATREFLKALSLAEKIDNDNFLCLLYGNLGQIFFQQNMLAKADSLFILSEKIATRNNDSCNLAMGLVARGNIRLLKKEYSDVMPFFERALVITKAIQNANAEKVVYNSIVAFYSSIGCPKETIQFAKEGLLRGNDSLSSARFYLLYGSALANYEKYDSAVVLLDKSLHTNSLHTKVVAYSLLSDIKKKQGDLNQALEYQNCYIECLDSLALVEKGVQKSITRGVMALYWEGIQPLLNKYQYFISGLLLLVCLLTIYLINRRCRYIALSHKKSFLEQKVKVLYAMQEDLKEKEQELKLLQEFVGTVEQDKAKLYTLITQVMSLKQENNDFFLKLMQSTRSYKALLLLIQKKKTNSKCKESFSEKDWDLLLSDIDYFSNGFVERLKMQAILLSDNDLRFCCLCKLGFSYTDMALVFERTLDAMYKKRNAILENKLKQMSNSKSLEDFIISI